MTQKKFNNGKAAVTITAVLCMISFAGCSKPENADASRDPILLGFYACTASPNDKNLLGYRKLNPSFLFLRDGTTRYTLKNGNLPSVTWYGNYRIDGDSLILKYDRSRIGNMGLDRDDLSQKFEILNISTNDFSMIQIYDSGDAANLWKMDCSH